MPEVIFSTPKIAKAHVWNIFSPSYSTLYIFLNTISVSDLRDKYCCFDSTRVVMLFKDHKAADTVRRQLGDSSNKIGKTIQPVFTSTKNKDFVETRAERPPLIDQESIGFLFKRGLCDASYVGYTRRYLFQRVSEHQSSAGIGNHVKKDHNLEPMNLKGEMQESTWLRDIWNVVYRRS